MAKSIMGSDLSSYTDYPFEAIDSYALGKLTEGPPILLGRYETIVLRCLECYLKVTNQTFDRELLHQRYLSYDSYSFLGALCSNRLIQRTREWKYNMCRAWIEIITKLKHKVPRIEIPALVISTVHFDAKLQSYIKDFEDADLCEEQVWLWGGWASTNKNGIQTFMPLYPVYRRLGRAFTQRMYDILDLWFSARKSQRVPCLRQLVNFIGSYPGHLTTKHLQDPNFSTEFWRAFFVYFVEKTHANGGGAKISSIITSWRNQFLDLAKDHLFRSGLFAEPWGDLPSPKPRIVSGARTHIKKVSGGQEVKTKLLTHIPLHLSDEQAYQILFRRIEDEFQEVVHIAQCARSDIWDRYLTRIRMAPAGTPCTIRKGVGSRRSRWLIDRENPERLLNSYATFAYHGFLSRTDADLSALYTQPLSDAAAELALPTSDSLLPHCILLIASHPEITSSFLENFELFDKNGKLIGLIEGDASAKLVGHKMRRGSQHAQQIIHLTAETAVIAQELISLSNPLREYLKSRGDDKWRYLLLTCGRAFAYPTRIRNPSISHSMPKRLYSFVDKNCHGSRLSKPDTIALIARVTLPAVRASAGVLVYLKTKSVQKMADALGHKSYSPRLLERYLPRIILEFFQERWIRVFQTGIIIEAMKTSDYLLPASGFSTMNEIHEFLTHSALKIPDAPKSVQDHDPAALRTSSSRRVLFGLSPSVLTALISLKLTVEESSEHVDGRAVYWSEITTALANQIEANKFDRPDLYDYLKQARLNARAYDPATIHAR